VALPGRCGIGCDIFVIVSVSECVCVRESSLLGRCEIGRDIVCRG